jgi:uncharacterized membrane protein
MGDETAAQGLQQGVADDSTISPEVLRAVAALDARLAHLLGTVKSVAPNVIHNVNDLEEEQLSLGDRIADWFASAVGSWNFIIFQSIILVGWILLNVVGWFEHWDPYPFILLNLALSFEAAYTAPIIMMSQNREGMKDRIRAQEDYMISKIAEDEIRAVIAHLERQDQVLLHILERLERSRRRRRTLRHALAQPRSTALPRPSSSTLNRPDEGSS